MGRILVSSLKSKYDLEVKVSEPTKESQNVDTWKIKIETRPEGNSIPAQRINIDICSVNSYDRIPMAILNPYGVDMGTSGLIIQAESLEEIYTDKLIALAFRPNRIKYRDLWDLFWLHGKGLKPDFKLIPLKLSDRNCALDFFIQKFEKRAQSLQDRSLEGEFKKEMQRFLPQGLVNTTLAQENFWTFLTYLILDLSKNIRAFFKDNNI